MSGALRVGGSGGDSAAQRRGGAVFSRWRTRQPFPDTFFLSEPAVRDGGVSNRCKSTRDCRAPAPAAGPPQSTPLTRFCSAGAGGSQGGGGGASDGGGGEEERKKRKRQSAGGARRAEARPAAADKRVCGPAAAPAPPGPAALGPAAPWPAAAAAKSAPPRRHTVFDPTATALDFGSNEVVYGGGTDGEWPWADGGGGGAGAAAELATPLPVARHSMPAPSALRNRQTPLPKLPSLPSLREAAAALAGAAPDTAPAAAATAAGEELALPPAATAAAGGPRREGAGVGDAGSHANSPRRFGATGPGDGAAMEDGGAPGVAPRLSGGGDCSTPLGAAAAAVGSAPASQPALSREEPPCPRRCRRSVDEGGEGALFSPETPGAGAAAPGAASPEAASPQTLPPAPASPAAPPAPASRAPAPTMQTTLQFCRPRNGGAKAKPHGGGLAAPPPSAVSGTAAKSERNSKQTATAPGGAGGESVPVKIEAAAAGRPPSAGARSLSAESPAAALGQPTPPGGEERSAPSATGPLGPSAGTPAGTSSDVLRAATPSAEIVTGGEGDGRSGGGSPVLKTEESSAAVSDDGGDVAGGDAAAGDAAGGGNPAKTASGAASGALPDEASTAVSSSAAPSPVKAAATLVVANPFALALRHRASADFAEGSFSPAELPADFAAKNVVALRAGAVPSPRGEGAAGAGVGAGGGGAATPPTARPLANKSMRFAFFARVLDEIESLKGVGAGSKKKSIVILTNAFRTMLHFAPMDLVPAAFICVNKIAPDYEGLETGVGEGILIRIMMELYGKTKKSIAQEVAIHEDLGRVAEKSRSTMQLLSKPPPLTVHSVFSVLRSLPALSGGKSQEKKKDAIKKLLAAAGDSEPKYIIRFLQQRLRVGAQSATVQKALADAFVLSPPDADKGIFIPDARRQDKFSPAGLETRLLAMEKAVKRALSEVSSLAVIIRHLQEGCTHETLNRVCQPTPGVPLQPMLAKPTKGVQEVLDRLGAERFTCEFKYDGERAQVHVWAGRRRVELFSRNLESLTEKYPDLILSIRELLRPEVEDCIVDCEVVAWDAINKKILPFQVLSTRKRKDVEAAEVAVRVCLFPFDCIRLNGRALARQPLRERRAALHAVFSEAEGRIAYARHAEVSAAEEIDALLQEAIDASCEGLMVKALDGPHAQYEPSKRSLNWLKVKKDYIQALTDSVDLVPVGAFYGRGSRARVFGAYLLACYDPKRAAYQTCCKAGTGFSQETLAELHKVMSDQITLTPHPSYSCRLVPDVWFAPVYVWEVRAADLSVSPVHTTALGVKGEDRGIGLRFPRFIRVRDDKKPEMATTAQQIIEMYNAQFSSSGAAATYSSDDSDSD